MGIIMDFIEEVDSSLERLLGFESGVDIFDFLLKKVI